MANFIMKGTWLSYDEAAKAKKPLTPDIEVIVLDDSIENTTPKLSFKNSYSVNPIVQKLAQEPSVVDLSFEEGELQHENDDDEVEFVGMHIPGSTDRKKTSKSISLSRTGKCNPKNQAKCQKRLEETKIAQATPVTHLPSPGSGCRGRARVRTPGGMIPVGIAERLKTLAKSNRLYTPTQWTPIETRTVKALKRLGKTRWGSPIPTNRLLAMKQSTFSRLPERKYHQAQKDYYRRGTPSRFLQRNGRNIKKRGPLSVSRNNGCIDKISSSSFLINPKYKDAKPGSFIPLVSQRTFVHPNEHDVRKTTVSGDTHLVGRNGERFTYSSTQPPLISSNCFLSSPTDSVNNPASLVSRTNNDQSAPVVEINMSAPHIDQHQPSGKLRPIVIDGSNVAMGHGNNKEFSCRGIKICADHFKRLGHETVIAFVPRFRTKLNQSVDTYILDELENEGIVKYTPSREFEGRKIASYDDRFVVQCAATIGGVIVSNDNFRDLLKEEPQWRNVIETRLLQFTWVPGDILMFPQDPLGRHGPRLAKFLKF